MEKSKTLLEILDLTDEPNILADIIDKTPKQEFMRYIKHDGRVKLEIEIENDYDDYKVAYSQYYDKYSHAMKDIPRLKRKYALHNKNYRVFINVKQNEKREA